MPVLVRVGSPTDVPVSCDSTNQSIYTTLYKVNIRNDCIEGVQTDGHTGSVPAVHAIHKQKVKLHLLLARLKQP